MEKKNGKKVAGFIIPSVIGIILFMVPVKHDGNWTVTVKIIADLIGGALGSILPILCVAIVTVSAIGSLIGLAKPKFMTESAILADTFCTTPVWAIVRVIGAVFIWMTYLGLGTEGGEDIVSMITDGGAGGFVLGDLLTVLVIIFLIAALLLPLLLDFGLWNMLGHC